MTLIFDDQSCLLKIGFNNFFDVIAFIFNGASYLFDI